MKPRRPVPITDRKFPLLPKLIATSLGVGFLPLCPGTWSAILATLLWLPLYIWAPFWVSLWVTAGAIIAVCVAGTWASTVSERYWGPDPVAACVDETVGQWIALLPLCVGADHAPWWLILVSLALFRLFDIFKPLGIRICERLPKGYGMMADDVLAGLYTAFIVLIINAYLLH